MSEKVNVYTKEVKYSSLAGTMVQAMGGELGERVVANGDLKESLEKSVWDEVGFAVVAGYSEELREVVDMIDEIEELRGVQFLILVLDRVDRVKEDLGRELPENVHFFNMFSREDNLEDVFDRVTNQHLDRVA